MDSLSRIPTAVQAALQAASSAAHAASPRDVPGLVELLEHLKELDAQLQLVSRPDESQLCELSMRMTERLVRQEVPTRDDLVPWVLGIIQYLGSALGVDLTDEWTSMKRPSLMRTPPPPRTGELRVAQTESDGHRIGEILVQMSFLDAAEVQRALQIQRETNCRLGEAMVLLGLITEKGLEAALKIQQRKRESGS
jgi:hypothetical protein